MFFKKRHVKVIIELTIPIKEDSDTDIDQIHKDLIEAIESTVMSFPLPEETEQEVNSIKCSPEYEDYKESLKFRFSYWLLFLIVFGAGVAVVPASIHVDIWPKVLLIVVLSIIFSSLNTLIKEEEEAYINE